MASTYFLMGQTTFAIQLVMVILHLMKMMAIFIQSSVDGHLGFFHILSPVNSAAMNIGCMYLFLLEFLSFPDIYLGVELLDHLVVLFVVV